MAKSKIVDLYWSPNPGRFDHVLHLNSIYAGGYAFYAQSIDLMGGPEQEIIVGETDFSMPFDIRSKFQPRAFSLVVTINEDKARYDALWHRRRHELLKAAYSGIVRVGVERTMSLDNGGTKRRLMFLEARCEGAKETEPGVFELSFLAADPVFTEYGNGLGDPNADVGELEEGDFSTRQQAAEDAWTPGDPEPENWMVDYQIDTVHTGNPSAGDASAEYAPAQYTPYVGSAPTEPVITFEVLGNGRVWRYRREFSVTNNAPVSLANYMVCIDLGQVLQSGGALYGKVNVDLGDIRIETFGGSRKQIYLRRHNNAGGQGSGDYLKVWFKINSLAPGETKYFRFLYYNPLALLESENSSVKMMFNGYTSTGAAWKYDNFLPRYDQPQSRSGQWVPHLQGRENITWLAYAHADFPIQDANLVNAAMGRAVYHGRATGYAGVQMSSGLAISSLSYGVQTRTNFKAPFVQRSQRADGRWVDDYADGTSTGNRAHPFVAAVAGATTIDLNMPFGSAFQMFNGDSVRFELDNGAVHNSTIDTAPVQSPYLIDPANNVYATRIHIATGIPASRSCPVTKYVYQNPSGIVLTASRTTTFSSGDEPRTVMIGIRSDSALDIAEFVYAGSDHVDVNFVSAEVPAVMWRATSPTGDFTSSTFAGGYEMDMDSIANGYQLLGRFQNDNDGKGIRVNLIMSHLLDRLVLDCKSRTCYYYPWDNVHRTWGAAENKYEALYFEEVRDYWLKMVPEQESTAVKFIHDSGSNFRNIRATVRWPNRYF